MRNRSSQTFEKSSKIKEDLNDIDNIHCEIKFIEKKDVDQKSSESVSL